MIPKSSLSQHPLPHFDEFRTNLQNMLTQLDSTIQPLKAKDESGDNTAKTYLYFFQGLFAVIDAEKKYRTGEYSEAATDFVEGNKLLTRFQRMSGGFSLEYQQATERLILFSKGREFECLALKRGTDITEQLPNLREALKIYQSESEVVEKQNKPILLYNAKARANFVQGLLNKLEGQQAFADKDLRVAKEKQLEAYRFFILASYFNPSFSVWIEEQNSAIKGIMNKVLREKASKEWGRAYSLANEGHFIESSERASIASKLYKRAARTSSEKRDSMMMTAYYYMLRASMFEAKANEYLRNHNDAKGAIPQFELAAEAMQNAVESLPNVAEIKNLQIRWHAQWQYYQGNFLKSQGIFNLDSEKYVEALQFFTDADTKFQSALQGAETAQEDNLIKQLKKAMAEAKGYIGMCKTVLD